MRSFAKAGGLVVGVAGLAGYGALRVALWPVRAAWRAVGGGERKTSLAARGPEIRMQKPR